MSDPACHSPETPAFTGHPVTQVTGLVRTDNRLVPVQEQRIADAAQGVIGAALGVTAADARLAEIFVRCMAPALNRLAHEMRAAGYRVGGDDEGARA